MSVQRATKNQRILADGSHYDAQYVSGDDKNDLALLRIQAKKPLPAVEIASGKADHAGKRWWPSAIRSGSTIRWTKGVIKRERSQWPPENRSLRMCCRPMRRSTPATRADRSLTRMEQLVGINMAILSQAKASVLQSRRRVANLLAGVVHTRERARLWLGCGLDARTQDCGDRCAGQTAPRRKRGSRRRTRLWPWTDRKSPTSCSSSAGSSIKRPVTSEIRCRTGGTAKSLAVKLAALPVLSAKDLMFMKFGVRSSTRSRAILAQDSGIPFTQGLLGGRRYSPAAPARTAQVPTRSW